LGVAVDGVQVEGVLHGSQQRGGEQDPGEISLSSYVAARPIPPDLRHVLDAFFTTVQEPEE
jgi:hypothetical protein